MKFIRSVLGDIEPDQLGVCYAHEHIIIDASYTTAQWPEFLLDSVEKGAAELSDFYQEGGRSMVDSMPCDSGRNILKLAEISKRSRVHILCPTGLHLAKYYDPGHWGNHYTEDQLAELFTADIESGIDRHDYSGPLVDRTFHRAGLIKIASDIQWTAREDRLFAVAGKVHRLTGAPLLTHTEKGELALKQIETLQQQGVDLAHVVLSHTDRKPEISYHREILSTGVRVEYDSAFRWKENQGNPTRDLVLALAPDYPNQILLGMDAARSSYWKHYGGAPGLSFLLTAFKKDLLDHGLDPLLWQRLMIDNPRDTYTFISPTEHKNRLL